MLNNIDRLSLKEGFIGEALYEKAACPICASNSKSIGKTQNINPTLPLTFDLRCCTQCGHVWVSPFPTQDFLNYLYSTASHSVIGAGWDQENKSRFTIPEELVRKATINILPGRYLEIGVGKGLLYTTFAYENWRCRGVEPGPWGPQMTGLVKSLEELSKNERFDVVVALDVLEHVADPTRMLDEIRVLCENSTMIYLAFPNVDSVRFHLNKGTWRMARPLGHVHYFSKKSAVKMLESSGLKAVSIQTTDLIRATEIKGVRSALAYGAQLAGWGDQLFITATTA